MSNTVRAASGTDSLINEMRMLAQTADPALAIEDADLERVISSRVTTILMLLLVAIIFATSALPDVGPSLAKVIAAYL